MLKKFTSLAGISSYSAENIRNTCGVTLFAYGAKPEQVARQMGDDSRLLDGKKLYVYKKTAAGIIVAAINLVILIIKPT